MKTALTIAAVCAGFLVGCGGDEEPSTTGDSSNADAIEQAASSDNLQAEVVQAFNAKLDQYGISYEYSAPGASNPCGIAVILTTPDEIALYEGAGDTILKNPDGTVGVKLSTSAGDDEACAKAADRALQSVGA